MTAAADQLEYPAAAPAALRERYVATFDLDPSCTLEMGWHLFGDRPERGQFLAALRANLAGAGVAEGGNLPDHLPTLLRLLVRQDASARSALAAAILPAATAVLERLQAQNSPFVDAMAAAVGELRTAISQEEQP
jgi:nitrate reductase delta subunit